MKKYLLSLSLLLVGMLGISSVYAISSTGWTVSGQNTNFDGTGLVGIGTNNPIGKLNIVGSNGVGQGIQLDNKEIKFRGDGVDHFSIFSNAYPHNLTINNTGDGPATGLTGVPLLSVGSTGKVGVGIVDGTGRLNVVGSAGPSQGISLDNKEIKFRGDGIAHFSLFANDTFGNFSINSTGDGPNTGIKGTPLMVVNVSGNVGVGNTTPSEKLQVQGNIKLTGNIKSSGQDICIGNC